MGDECPCSEPIIDNIILINASSMEAKDGSIQIELVPGSYTYQWSDPALSGASVTGLAAGSYTVTITDTRSTTCVRVETIVVGNSELGPINVVSTTASECGVANGSALIEPSNFTYALLDLGCKMYCKSLLKRKEV